MTIALMVDIHHCRTQNRLRNMGLFLGKEEKKKKAGRLFVKQAIPRKRRDKQRINRGATKDNQSNYN
ncbi:hypothetical protein KP509_19G015700 [Ceratopteris richardii]|uniref:Uncharacterized protein n=1 Tax=Ceratopteris richardii TaxID=49495 RepID=A0A8T2SK02_CERRI|nr:hypothetical protein KP509_19G015700 [Ceratopteris richardii]